VAHVPRLTSARSPRWIDSGGDALTGQATYLDDDTDSDDLRQMVGAFEHVRRLGEINDHLTATT
jgi:hypothetical protein